MLLIHIQGHHRHGSNLRGMLQLHARQQNRVPRVPEPYGGRISGASDHQLGRDFMGEEALGIVGRPGDPGDSLPHGSHAARLFGLQGKRLAAASLFPLHPGARQHYTIHDHVTLSTNEKPIHSGVPKLLVGKAFLGKYVQRFTQSHAEVPVSFESATDDP